jgi:uncharacterized protein (TIRG00374 family)
LKKIAITVLKYGISLSILAWLFWQAWHSKTPDGEYIFPQLYEQSKNWWLLGAGLVVCIAAVTSTIVRWWLLVRALKMPFTLPDALRLGFVGFLYNFLTLGVLGGDLVKAIFLARKQPGRRTEAIASIVIDRIIGLYALFVVASVAILCVDWQQLHVADPGQLAKVRTLCSATLVATAIGTLGIFIVALPSFGRSPLYEWLHGLPKVGTIFERVTTAVRIYRDRPWLMGFVGVSSLGTHVLNVLSVYLIARGLPGEVPSLGLHFVIVNIANVANTLPLPGGIGGFELVFVFMYRGFASANMASGQGFVVALGYRIATLVVAMIGVGYYLTSRQEMKALLKEAEREEAAEHDRDAAPASAIGGLLRS